MNYLEIIGKYYENESAELRSILITHSTLVMKRAVSICNRHPELHMDKTFIEEAAMLHDIGICRCDASGIQCFGDQPSI